LSHVKARNSSGFTLIELLVSSAIAGAVIAAGMAALGTIEHAEARGREKELLVRITQQKYDEIMATYDLSQANSLSGDFTDHNDTDHTWTATVAATNTTTTNSVVNTASTAAAGTVDYLSVKVASNSNPNQTYTVTGLVYIPPQTGTGTAATGTAGGGAAGRGG
jgi:prepilin-type N-terminal cleavage/methylation domain-containing protein